MKEKVIQMIVEQLNVDEKSINENTSLKDDLGADSLDLFELVSSFEDEFGVEIPTEDLEKLDTAANVVAYLEK